MSDLKDYNSKNARSRQPRPNLLNLLEITPLRLQNSLRVHPRLQCSQLSIWISLDHILLRRVSSRSQSALMATPYSLHPRRPHALLDPQYTYKFYVAPLNLPSSGTFYLMKGKKILHCLHSHRNFPPKFHDQLGPHSF